MAAANEITSPAEPTVHLPHNWKVSKKVGPLSRSTRSFSSNSRTWCCLGFTRKCSGNVRQHRARFYIMCRCAVILLCWRDYSDS